MPIPKDLKNFAESQKWIFAKTYAETYPHENIVQEKVDSELFLELGKFIDENGYEEYFYSKKQIYFDFEGFTYWHMENIINRCVIEDTYHIRKQNNRLPAKDKF
ncbi:hypothetical protein [Chryseobacterium sp. R2A-55]|uniref:hypothetical protein n=1 Tax=Chryseobacterium sp. R2A-55 TaxID=2744445 RepID=UPI001F2DBF68|nr:hypothetical protein [Chryseobacterium sp. R2A-55]